MELLMSDPKPIATAAPKKIVKPPTTTDEDPTKKDAHAKKKDQEDTNQDERAKEDGKKDKTDTTKKDKDKETTTTTKKTKDKDHKRPSISKSKRAQLQFPVGKIRSRMKKSAAADTNRVADNAPVYLAAVLEYLAAETLELAGDAASQSGKKRIAPKHLFVAVENDTELRLLFNADMIDTAVNPIETRNIILAAKAKKYRDKKKKLERIQRREEARAILLAEQAEKEKAKKQKEKDKDKKTTTKEKKNKKKKTDESTPMVI